MKEWAVLCDVNKDKESTCIPGYFLKFSRSIFNLLSLENTHFVFRENECVNNTKKYLMYRIVYSFVCQIPSSNSVSCLKKESVFHFAFVEDKWVKSRKAVYLEKHIWGMKSVFKVFNFIAPPAKNNMLCYILLTSVLNTTYNSGFFYAVILCWHFFFSVLSYTWMENWQHLLFREIRLYDSALTIYKTANAYFRVLPHWLYCRNEVIS